MEKTRQEEIEKVHDKRHNADIKTLTDEGFKRAVIVEATNSYTNLDWFALDYDIAYDSRSISKYNYIASINNLYLLALQHITDEQYDLLLLKESVTI